METFEESGMTVAKERKAPKQRKTTSSSVDPHKPASIIINDRFNGLTHFCRLTGYATSTAHHWLTRGYIPAQRKGESIHAHILAVAEKARIKMKPQDFVEAVAPAPSDV